MAHFYSKLEGAVEDYKEVIPLLQKKELEEYLKMTRFERASCVFLGDTGVGKSFLINNILKVTLSNQFNYNNQRSKELEALSDKDFKEYLSGRQHPSPEALAMSLSRQPGFEDISTREVINTERENYQCLFQEMGDKTKGKFVHELATGGILPCGSQGGPTTAVLYRIRHGYTIQVLEKRASLNDLLEVLISQLNRLDQLDQGSESPYGEREQCEEIVLTLTLKSFEELDQTLGDEDLEDWRERSEELKSLLCANPELGSSGECKLWKGEGRNIFLDLGLARKRIHKLSEEASIFFKEVVLYLPCDLLKNLELVDAPGTNVPSVTDTLYQQQAIRSASCIFLVVRKIVPQSVLGVLHKNHVFSDSKKRPSLGVLFIPTESEMKEDGSLDVKEHEAEHETAQTNAKDALEKLFKKNSPGDPIPEFFFRYIFSLPYCATLMKRKGTPLDQSNMPWLLSKISSIPIEIQAYSQQMFVENVFPAICQEMKKPLEGVDVSDNVKSAINKLTEKSFSDQIAEYFEKEVDRFFEADNTISEALKEFRKMVKEHVEKINVKGGWEGLIERGRRTYTEVNRANGYKGKGPRHQMLKEAFRMDSMNPGHDEYIPLRTLAGGDLDCLRPHVKKVWEAFVALGRKIVVRITEMSQPKCFEDLMKELEGMNDIPTRRGTANVTSTTLRSLWQHHLFFEEKIGEFLEELTSRSLDMAEDRVQELMKKHVYFTESGKKGNKVTVEEYKERMEKGSIAVNKALPRELNSDMRKLIKRVTWDFYAESIYKSSVPLQGLFEEALLRVNQAVELGVRERQKEFLSLLEVIIKTNAPTVLDSDLLQEKIARNVEFLFLDGLTKQKFCPVKLDSFSGECWHSSKSLESCLSRLLGHQSKDLRDYFDHSFRPSDETTENDWSTLLSKILFDNASFANNLKCLAMQKFSAKFEPTLSPPRDPANRPPNALYLVLAATRSAIGVPVLIWIPGVSLPLLFDGASTQKDDEMKRVKKKIHPLQFTLTRDTNHKIGLYILSPLKHISPSFYRVEYKRGETGWTFKRMWGEMVKRAKMVFIRDYTGRPHQWHNLREFLEMLVEVNESRNHGIDVIVFGTIAEVERDPRAKDKQKQFFEELKGHLMRHHDVKFQYSFVDRNVHDRKIEVVYSQNEISRASPDRILDCWNRPQGNSVLGYSNRYFLGMRNDTEFDIRQIPKELHSSTLYHKHKQQLPPSSPTSPPRGNEREKEGEQRKRKREEKEAEERKKARS